MASFDDNRDLLAAELFSKKPPAAHTANSTPPKEGLRHKCIKLERLRKQELARWWDITNLKRYLELKQIPRGLRVIIFPSFEDLDPDLLGEWEHLISSTSFSMINILIKHEDRKRSKLLLDIASLEEEIKSLNLVEATDKNYTIMKEILNEYQLYVKDKKMRKLIRDENDYSNGRIYTFARKFDQINRDTHNTQTSNTTPSGLDPPTLCPHSREKKVRFLGRENECKENIYRVLSFKMAMRVIYGSTEYHFKILMPFLIPTI
ncbi:hypothetical protein NDU88_005313 [Pleurodeles waltl]|uniref:Uncharacterized protein n=1 Tax=Pleurodeles waltl TaxID=8319 RepID=A0AAV7LL45_PLEWA|nr:hypothetical protein NDU88_005313 [Pleurodeles waltl]